MKPRSVFVLQKLKSYSFEAQFTTNLQDFCLHFRSALRSTPSPKSYHSIGSQSPGSSRVRFTDQSDFEEITISGPPVKPKNIKNSSQGSKYYFRPITKQHSSPVHVKRYYDIDSDILKPEPLHYTGISQRALQVGTLPNPNKKHHGRRGSGNMNTEFSLDEGYYDSDTAFILGTFPRTHSEWQKYQQQGSLYNRTLPWEMHSTPLY